MTPGRARTWDRAGGILGLLFVLLALPGFLLPETPDYDQPVERIAAQLADDRDGLLAGRVVGLVSAIAFIGFLAALWGRLRRYEGFAGPFATLFLIGATGSGGAFTVLDGISLAVIKYGSTAEPDPAVLRALTVLEEWMFVPVLPVFAMVFAGVAGAILTSRALPRWLGWIAALIALLFLVGLFAALFREPEESPLIFFVVAAFLLWLLWTVVLSIVLLVRPGGGAGPS